MKPTPEQVEAAKAIILVDDIDYEQLEVVLGFEPREDNFVHINAASILLAALEAAERAYGLLEEAHKSTTEKFADMMARVRELECVRDALIRSEESANQLEEMVSNQAREYLERAEAAEGKLEAAEADSARLDWLQHQLANMDSKARGTWLRIGDKGRVQVHRYPLRAMSVWDDSECVMDSIPDGTNDLREAIDAARKAQP